ncbi:MAG TPA: SLC13 family permease [Bacteroidales bacterium]|nr:SLC13 family permease [Bacteroidales bacterium]
MVNNNKSVAGRIFRPTVTIIIKMSLLLIFSFIPLYAGASDGKIPSLGPVRFEFIIFGLILLGVALFHNQTLKVALTGLVILIAFKLVFDSEFDFFKHIFGERSFSEQIINKDLREGEWSILLNLAGLLLGFAILSRVFEQSGVPIFLLRILPGGWKGALLLLFFIFILSSFLDNIAAALIGGTIASVVFKNKVHVGYLAAIVAASNAGGSWSVIGDTTTTMMWIDGVSPLNILHGFIAAMGAFLFFSWFASRQQDRYQTMTTDISIKTKIDSLKLLIVFMILAGAIISNFLYNMPALGVWIAILASSLIKPIPWKEVPGSIKGTIFLLSLVFCASLMPVQDLPDASWYTAFFLGLLSAVFDNIPLTKLCLEQGYYDWGMLAYTVGFGGSIIWFGSSAGVAITNKFPEARHTGKWLKNGWHVAAAYLVGFTMLLLIVGWHPSDSRNHKIKDLKILSYSLGSRSIENVSVSKSP